jgi:uncharacterized membrane protein
MRIHDDILIGAPIFTVWAVTEDICAWPAWSPTITSVRRMTPGPVGPGAAFLVRQPLQRAAVWTITDLVPGHLLSWERAWRGTTLRATHMVDAEGTRARSTLTLETDWTGARLIAPILRRALRAENRALRRACEAATRLAPVRP